jgi:multidrug efflux pump subunit AcrB
VATFFIVAAGLVSGFVPFLLGIVPTGMFSANSDQRLRLTYEFTDFTYKSDAERAVSQIEDFLYANAKDFSVKGVYSYFTENDALSMITLADEDLSERELQELRQKIRDRLPQIPGARVFFEDSSETGGSSTYFAVKFFGPDSAELTRLAEEAERRLATVQGVEDITTPARRARREIQVSIDRGKALRHGLTAQDVSDVFAFTLGGMRRAASTPAITKSRPGWRCGRKTAPTSKTSSASRWRAPEACPCCWETSPTSTSSAASRRSGARTAKSAPKCAPSTKARNGTTPRKRSPA